MFTKRNRATKELAVIEREVTPLSTREYVLQCATSWEVGKGEMEKRWAISSVATHSYTGGLTREIVEGLVRCGFRMFVNSKFTEKFRYYALFRGEKDCCYNTFYRSKYIYTGDVPIAVVEKAQIAIKQGIKYLTIHSNHLLPLSGAMLRVDPVLIGWVDNPDMHGVWACDGGNLYRDERSIGVIIAAWDMDRELVL